MGGACRVGLIALRAKFIRDPEKKSAMHSKAELSPGSMDWWENLQETLMCHGKIQWFPVKIVPLNQSIDWRNSMGKALFSERAGKSRNLGEDIGAKLGKTGGIQDSARVQDWSELGITKS